jgi:3-methyladenine DNA glycosylase AlkD
MKTITKTKTDPTLAANSFLEQLQLLQSDAELKKIKRYFPEERADDIFIGVRMGDVFKLAKAYMNMPLPEIKKLLKNKIHEARVGAVSIMDFQARSKKITEERRKELFDLYINNHKYINNWDLVDRSAPYVVGTYLLDKPREILYVLAVSKNTWERRTAIVSTYQFIRHGETADTFKIAEILVNDKEDLVNKATGSWLRTAGDKNKKALLAFLDKYAATMPRITLRYAIEKLDKKQREHYLGL